MISLVAALVLAAMPLPDEAHCTEHARVRQMMQHIKYEEVFTDPIRPDLLLHVYAGKDGQWMLTFSTTDNTECLIQTGNGWPTNQGASID